MSPHGTSPIVAVEEVARSREPLQTLARASVEINAARDSARLLDGVGRYAREVVGARQAAVSLTADDSHAQTVVAVSLDLRFAAWSDYAAPTDGSGVYSLPVITGRPLRLTPRELEDHPGWRAFGSERDRHPPLRGLLAVPMIGRDGDSLGLIQLSDRLDGDFDEDDEAMLVQLAQIASVAVERLGHERELRAERDRIRTIVDSVVDGVVTTGPGAVIESVSPSFCRMTGFTTEDLIGVGPPYPFWPADAMDDIRRAIGAYRGGSSHEFDLLFRRADGSVFPVLVSAAPLDGGSGAGVAVVKDMTARNAHEEELRRSRRMLAEAQRIAHLGSWSLDLSGLAPVEWSDEVHRITGVGPGPRPPDLELFMELVHPDDRELLLEALRRSVDDGVPYVVEHRLVRPDGEVRTVLEQGEIERDAAGTALRIIGTMLDVTGRRRAEDEARAQAERVTALAEERGRLVADALTAEERARQHLAEVLHDDVLQDLLAARQEVVEAARRPDAGDPEILDRARQGIVRATARLREVVGELHPVTLTHGGLETALRAVAESIASRAGFRVTYEVEPAALGVHDRLVLALAREFLVNVEKHADAGHAHVRVARTGAGVRLTVSDDGRGFTPQVDGEAFYRGHIGLPSARERVAALGGGLTIESAPGRGARVVAVIPPAAAAA